MVPADSVDFGFVYAVHRDDGSVAYIGQTIDYPAMRFRGHVRDAVTGSSTPFHRWLRHQIVAGHSPRVSTIETCPRDMLLERETYWIRHHHADQNGGTLNAAGLGDAPAPRAPLSAEEFDELNAVVARLVVIAEETRRRENADTIKPFFDLVKPFFDTRGDGPHSMYAIEVQANSILNRASKPSVTRDLLQAIAHRCGFEHRGDPECGCLVRRGTLADELSDPTTPLNERIVLFVEKRTSRRGLTVGPLSNAVVADGSECKSALVSMGWTKRAGRGEWDAPAKETAA